VPDRLSNAVWNAQNAPGHLRLPAPSRVRSTEVYPSTSPIALIRGATIARKAGACVSTVGIVCSREKVMTGRARLYYRASMVEPGDEEARRRLSCDGIRSNLADAADGADGILAGRTHPDDPISGAAFTTERNLNAHGLQEGVSPVPWLWRICRSQTDFLPR
jgi:hypothetical protein